MLRAKATIGYIGLAEREIMVIQSIFRMTEKFHAVFELPRENERRAPDVLFIDYDTPGALTFWEEFNRKVNPYAIAVFVSAEKQTTSGEYHISRPLVLRKLTEVLDSIMKHYTSNLAEMADASCRNHFESASAG